MMSLIVITDAYVDEITASPSLYEQDKKKLNENKVNQRNEPTARTKEQTRDTGYLNPAR